ncbi:hypothetical protein GCM10028805_58160 [Spirosoma harenae]
MAVLNSLQSQLNGTGLAFPTDTTAILDALLAGNCQQAGTLLGTANGNALIDITIFNDQINSQFGQIQQEVVNTVARCSAPKPTISSNQINEDRQITQGTTCRGCIAGDCSKYWVYFNNATNLQTNWYERADYTSADYRGKTWAIDGPYALTGGDEKYFRNSATRWLGNYVTPDADKFFGNNPTRESSSQGKFRFVITNTQFLLSNENSFATEQDLVNQLLGDFIHDIGPENIVFPHNGKFANILKKSIPIGDVITRWSQSNFDTRNVFGWAMDLRGEINVDVASGLTSLEHFMGSVAVRINMQDRQNVKFEVFNITSFTSGYLTKDLPIIGHFVDSPNSTVRSSEKHTYSNTSQYVSFTLTPSEINSIIRKFCPGTNCRNYNP